MAKKKGASPTHVIVRGTGTRIDGHVLDLEALDELPVVDALAIMEHFPYEATGETERRPEGLVEVVRPREAS